MLLFLFRFINLLFYHLILKKNNRFNAFLKIDKSFYNFHFFFRDGYLFHSSDGYCSPSLSYLIFWANCIVFIFWCEDFFLLIFWEVEHQVPPITDAMVIQITHSIRPIHLTHSSHHQAIYLLSIPIYLCA